MLEEQGKLKVEDEITKYIPDHPTLGKAITIHHLLNHTSGIKSYTSMDSFMPLARTDMTPTEIIDKFKNAGNVSVGKEVDKAPPSEKMAITLEPEVLAQYIGKYQLQPGFVIEVTTKDNQIFAQATGQPQIELFPEDEDTFFLKVVPASVDFNKDENGSIISLTLHQGGQDMEGKKIN